MQMIRIYTGPAAAPCTKKGERERMRCPVRRLLAAFFAALFGLSVQVQLVLFLAVSFVLLIFTKPFVSRFVNRDTERTNADGLIGKKGKVTAQIDNAMSAGAVVVSGQEWTARSAKEETVIPVGETVVIREIRGGKLIVEPATEVK